MRYVFIVNPAAGKFKGIQKKLYEIQLLRQRTQRSITVYLTEKAGHATQLAKKVAETASEDDPLRIYACGGDGTINEVLQGIIGKPYVELGCVPIGSGNDFIKNFNKEDFLNLEKQILAPSVPIDTIHVSGEFGSRYALNVISFSWDSRVAIEVERFKKIPFIKGPIAYAFSIVDQLVKKESTVCSIVIDGEEIPAAEYMIGMCANGAYYGGSFKGAPYAKIDDGLLELVTLTTVTRRKVARLFPVYQRGEHLPLGAVHPDFAGLLSYKQGKEITISSEKPLPITIDGEGVYTKQITCRIQPKHIRLILASGNSPALTQDEILP